MTPFDSLYEQAAARKDGAQALEKLLGKPRAPQTLARIPDDRWLSEIAKSVFRAGFNWTVVEQKWPDIEAAFDGFEPARIAAYADEELEALLKDPRIIRHWKKLKAIRANAGLLVELAGEHGSAARFFAHYPSDDFVGLLDVLKRRGSYLGGTSAQYFLRMMGVDSFILSNDVVTALRREKAFDGSPTSKSSLRSIQSAFNAWVADGGGSLTRVSRVLAFTVE